MKEDDIKHLEWIYGRMIINKENVAVDYMIKFKSIIDDLHESKIGLPAQEEMDNFNNSCNGIQIKINDDLRGVR